MNCKCKKNKRKRRRRTTENENENQQPVRSRPGSGPNSAGVDAQLVSTRGLRR